MNNLPDDVTVRSRQLERELHHKNYCRVDRLFVGLMCLQWIAGMLTAVYISPYTWIGEQALVHFHVRISIVLGGLISTAPVLMGVFYPGHVVTRHVIAVSQALWGALLIHLSGGRIETHFHVFGSLAFIAFYRDWKVLLTMTIVVTADHFVRGVYFPLSVYGIALESPYRWLEHAGWVVFEDLFLFLACLRGTSEAQALCQQQAELEHTNVGIEEIVKERSRDLRTAKLQAEHALAEAERANQLKSQFLANMSHELRTPLNGVMGMLDLLMESRLDTRQHDYATVSRESAQSLLRIINDILDYSKIEANQMKLESISFDLQRMLEEIAALGAAQVSDGNVEVVLHFSTGIPRGVMGDPLRLRQVLTNLLNNALKFTKSGHVILEARTCPEAKADENVVRFAVRDTGVGIPDEKIEHIFGKFNQADSSTTREFGGTGLGLAISDHLVSLMGGSIAVSSTLGEGSEFAFEVSLPSAGIPDHAESYPALQDARVLVVDDLQINRDILAGQLQSHVVSVDTCDSAEAALALLRNADPPYDIVITDYQMPHVDGRDLGIAIRDCTEIVQPRLILLSSNCSALSQCDLRSIGFEDYLIKPASRGALLAALQAALPGCPNGVETAVDGDDEAAAKDVNMRVLLVDDNEINLLVAQESLLSLGCDVVTCGDGQQAIDQLRDGHFDIVLMDCQMPVMDGYEATKRIREFDDPKAGIPIIALTANALSGDRERCIDAGMDDHISKPFRPAELREILRRHLSHAPFTE